MIGNRLVSLIVASMLLAGCVSPAERFDHRARALELESGEIAGEGFRHRIYNKSGNGNSPGGGWLHVYFGGDGTPFLRRDLIATDPTPRQPLTLDLMALDPRPAVLLGRPCYHGLTRGCEPGSWTIGRYSEAVVASLTAATERLIQRGSPRHVMLIGYSGGGVLAVLVAERLRAVDAVLTVAANLDPDAWTARHGYSPLSASLNPALLPRHRADLAALHLAGAEDGNVPPEVQARYTDRLSRDSVRVIEGFDHRCCWADRWLEWLAEVEARVEGAAPPP